MSFDRKNTTTTLYGSPNCNKKSHFDKKCPIFCPQFKNLTYLCTRSDAQMAESVDALVSNTNGVTPVPVRPRLWVRIFKRKALKLIEFWRFYCFLLELYLNFWPSIIISFFASLMDKPLQKYTQANEFHDEIYCDFYYFEYAGIAIITRYRELNQPKMLIFRLY